MGFYDLSSGSLADSSSNGNSNGNGSSDNGSSDTYGDQESFIRRQQRTLDDQTRLPEQQQQQQDEQLMVELNPQVQVQHYNIDYQSDGMSGENDSSTQLKPISQEQQQPSSDSGYTSQTYYNGNKSPSQRPQWNNRSNQIMRGMLPVEFVHHIPPSSAEQRPESTLKEPSTADIDKDKEDQADRQMSIGNKRRSPRINKSRSTSQT